ncbi:lipoxygenase family protein [Acanthopleuribacter pedis]|uniref:catalase n=1 Tax=Acanthopleuribacter pedis TaxID=442870 RepID=A0A8J7QG14_9BACT|nr:lipoxygenase family protein [Acanthopleuribacter pedis]MBO1319340.1 catalase [Acanthopleuribacter pedis]
MSSARANDPRLNVDPLFGGLIYTIASAFRMLAQHKKGRATHTVGVTARGTFTVSGDNLPAHAVFTPGRTFPVVVRHASIKGFDDDAIRDGRGLSLRLFEGDADSEDLDLQPTVLDVLSSTGSRFFMNNAVDFGRWVAGDMETRAALVAEFPKILPIFHKIVKNPDSFTKVYYYSETTTRFIDHDGKRYHMRYRFRNADGSCDSGEIPIEEITLPKDYVDRPTSDTRPKDYLRAEFTEQVTNGGVSYLMEVQLKPESEDEIYNEIARDCTVDWTEAEAPFLEVGTISLNQMLSPAEDASIAFNVGNAPEALGLILARTPFETASINHLRSLVYDFSAAVRQGRPLPAGLANLNNAVTGMVFHLDQTPLRDTLIEIWRADPVTPRLMATTRTNQSGRFKHAVNFSDPMWSDRPPIFIKVIRNDTSDHPAAVHQQPAPPNYDFGFVAFPYWEYQVNSTLPQILRNDLIASPQPFVPAQLNALMMASAKLALIQADHAEDTPVPQVQQDYDSALGKNLTERLEEETPGGSRGDHFFAYAVLNGFNPAFFSRDGDGLLHVRYNFDDYEFDGKRTAPNVHLTMEARPDGLVPLSIEYRLRHKEAIQPEALSFAPAVLSKPGDDHWETAKAYFRIAEFIQGQALGHLGRGHLNVGQYAIAFYRNIQHSPIYTLLHPHLKGVTAINDKGNGIIFGKTGILAQQSPLVADSVIKYMEDDLGACNWKGWKPRASLGKFHRYGAVGELWWDLLDDYVADFFAENASAIAANWDEIYHFSQNLVARGVAYRATPLPDGESWYDDGEISDPGDNGKALSQVTNTAANPTEADWDNLKQLCVYVIFHATLWHCWRNDNQVNFGGEIDYARLALHYDGIDASRQLLVTHSLVSVRHGFVTRNEDGDIPARLIRMLEDEAEAFQAVNYSIDAFRSRINI